MPAYKDKAKGTWYVSFYYENRIGKKEKKMKRGFKTRREALEWERIFLQQKTSDLNMTFEDFVPLYIADMKNRFKESTWLTKEHIIRTKLVPYFGKRKMCDICSKDVMTWQNEMMGHRSEAGKAYSPVYLKTLHNQLSAVFNHAVRHYGLKANPAAQAGNMGKAKNGEIQFWTKAEYLQFIEAMMDKPRSFYAFEMLYWTGIREGELLALTPADFDFEKQTVSITKSYLFREMERGCKETGVKRIKVHGLRHSHISLLIDMGFSALAIADRVGRESIDITYRYAQLFPTRQTEMANKLDMERKEDEACH